MTATGYDAIRFPISEAARESAHPAALHINCLGAGPRGSALGRRTKAAPRNCDAWLRAPHKGVDLYHSARQGRSLLAPFSFCVFTLLLSPSRFLVPLRLYLGVSVAVGLIDAFFIPGLRDFDRMPFRRFGP